jgi:glycosyltransferase involved in cell wall biosynthesis
MIASDRKPILFLSRWFPYPADNGARIRIYNLLKELSAQYEITLVTFCDPDQGGAEALRALQAICAEVYPVPTPVFSLQGWKATRDLFSPLPRWVIASDSQEFRQILEKLSQRQFAACVASEIDMARYALELPEIPKILEELEVSAITERPGREKGLLRKIRTGLTARKYKRYLSQIVRRFDGVSTVSAVESQAITRAIPGVKAPMVIPNGVDLDYYSGIEQKPEPDTLIYTGALTYFANLDAMRFFLNEVFPLILKERPDTRLKITGKVPQNLDPQLALDHFRSEQVILTGYLPDIRPAISQSWISVVPLRIGGGTRLKILESLAVGTPVVATAKGVEGLDLVAGTHVLVADRPEDFAASVVRLLGDSELRQWLSQRGKAAVAQGYDWPSIGQKFRDFLASTIQ